MHPIPLLDTLPIFMAQYQNFIKSDNPAQAMKEWLEFCFSKNKHILPEYAVKDFQSVAQFLHHYHGNSETFNAYRRELERLLQWSWLVQKRALLAHKREDIESFIRFCIKPALKWIGLQKVPKFTVSHGQKMPNKAWRPFVVHCTKKEYANGVRPEKKDYLFSQAAMKALFKVLGSFYRYLLEEETIQANPVALIRQKSKFLRKESSAPIVRRLSETQWKTILQITKTAATKNRSPKRTLFILSCLYSLYLRISELVASDNWTPTMGDFFKDSEENWWFKTVGKGNKARQIAVSEDMLQALKDYRVNYLNLDPLPLPGDKMPLIGHLKNPNNPLTNARPIRRIVQTCFDAAVCEMLQTGDKEEAEMLRSATVHWLRHTGISEDVKHRPKEHVRDDAGHSSSSITDRYIDVALKERAESARKKSISMED